MLITLVAKLRAPRGMVAHGVAAAASMVASHSMMLCNTNGMYIHTVQNSEPSRCHSGTGCSTKLPVTHTTAVYTSAECQRRWGLSGQTV